MVLDDFDCPICHDVFIEPATLVCGHTGCRECIDAWIGGGFNTCPLGCATIIPRSVPVRNILISNLMNRRESIVGRIARRKKEIARLRVENKIPQSQQGITIYALFCLCVFLVYRALAVSHSLILEKHKADIRANLECHGMKGFEYALSAYDWFGGKINYANDGDEIEYSPLLEFALLAGPEAAIVALLQKGAVVHPSRFVENVYKYDHVATYRRSLRYNVTTLKEVEFLIPPGIMLFQLEACAPLGANDHYHPVYLTLLSYLNNGKVQDFERVASCPWGCHAPFSMHSPLAGPIVSWVVAQNDLAMFRRWSMLYQLNYQHLYPGLFGADGRKFVDDPTSIAIYAAWHKSWLIYDWLLEHNHIPETAGHLWCKSKIMYYLASSAFESREAPSFRRISKCFTTYEEVVKFVTHYFI